MEIVEKKRLLVIGLPVRAAWRDLWTEMPKAWRELFARESEIECRSSGALVNVSLDVDNGEYLQLVGAEVEQAGRVPQGMMVVDIPAQRYIHHEHRGNLEGIADSFGDIYRWAKDNGYAASEFKLDIGYTSAGDEASHDLYVATHPQESWRIVEAP